MYGNHFGIVVRRPAVHDLDVQAGQVRGGARCVVADLFGQTASPSGWQRLCGYALHPRQGGREVNYLARLTIFTSASRSAGCAAGTLTLPHTPVTILTGFLGSGKTTLLNRALRDPAMANTAVVINEFGEVGLDHLLAAQSNDTIMVLENGCLCCTVFGDLVTTLNNLDNAR